MSPQEIQSIHGLLMTRVQPRDVREGVAIAALAAKLVQHFQPKTPELGQKDSRVASPANAPQHSAQPEALAAPAS